MTGYPERILMTADTVGGVWTYALELIRSLARYDVQVVLATMGRPLSQYQREAVQSLPGLSIHESSFKLEWMQDPWDDVEAAGEWLLGLEETVRPDIVHLNGYAHAALPWLTPRVVVAHSCVLSWWRAVHRCEAPATWDTYREAVTLGLQSAELVAAPSSAMLQTLDENYGKIRNAIVIPNGREIPDGEVEKEPFIFSAGRLWDEAKNVSALTKVASQLDWPLFIAGEQAEPGTGDCTAAVKHEAITLGSLSAKETVGWFRRASIYALPACYEPFGLSVLEAALCGCALILGDIPSLREIWGDAAVFVTPHDTDQLRKVLNELTNDPKQLVTFAGKAKKRAARYTPDLMARRYLAAYQTAATRHPLTNLSQPLPLCAS